MMHVGSGRIVKSAVLAALFLVSCPIGRADAPPPPGVTALDYAFQFASAIKSDAKDRGKAQASVVLDYAAIDATERALERAALVEGWRRATAFADLAAHLAKTGRAEPARSALARADEFGARVEGWEGPRISAHVAQALAEMGETDRSSSLAKNLATQDSRQYAGRSAATIAASHAARGDFAAAMTQLAGFDGQDDFEITWWRTAGYLGVARQTKLTAAQRGQALDAARRSAEKIAGWKRAEALESIAGEYALRDDAETARTILEQAEAEVRPLPDSLSIKAPLLSNLARAWTRAGDSQRAHDLLALAETAVPNALLIDQPAIWANLASSYLTLREEAQAWTLYERALTEAQNLVNSRPRAQAVVEILRSIGRANQPLPDSTRARLDALLSGLGDPW